MIQLIIRAMLQIQHRYKNQVHVSSRHYIVLVTGIQLNIQNSVKKEFIWHRDKYVCFVSQI